jgi:hypothetical protein
MNCGAFSKVRFFRGKPMEGDFPGAGGSNGVLLAVGCLISGWKSCRRGTWSGAVYPDLFGLK